MQKQQFTFWLANSKEYEFSLSVETLRVFFRFWLQAKDATWLGYYGANQVTLFYIGAKDGLNSALDQKEAHEIVDALSSVFLDVLKEKEDQENEV